ncbi:MAG: hypothetical protein OXR73_01485 [Myxococcales bacterium]|nr:hypothetical protein [Myxococcales bacterium]
MRWWFLWALPLVGLLEGCLEGKTRALDGGAPGMDNGMEVQIGIPDPEIGAGFLPLERDGDIVLDTFGQGGSHAELALACRGFGTSVFPQFAVENLADGSTIMTACFSAPQPLLCDDEELCIDSPNFVMLGGLADPDELDGLHVRVTARVESASGEQGEASQTGYLRRE